MYKNIGFFLAEIKITLKKIDYFVTKTNQPLNDRLKLLLKYTFSLSVTNLIRGSVITYTLLANHDLAFIKS